MKKIFTLFLFVFLSVGTHAQQIPGYLKDYVAFWKQSPRLASLEWFKEAGFGMFVHFSPASQLPGGTDEYAALDTWFETQKGFEQMDRHSRKKQLLDKMTKVSPGAERLIRSFNPENFNADSLADLALRAGMKYVTFTTQHVVGKMYMFDTSLSEWNSQKLLGRDFVKELSVACEKRGLGLFLYVTPPNDNIQVEIRIMLKELLTNYGPIAGIWFDGIGECLRCPADFLEAGGLYAYIRDLQPQCLISFKTGFTGDEDFIAPEWRQVKFDVDNRPVLAVRVRTHEGTDAYLDAKNYPVLRVTSKGSLAYVYQNFKDVWDNELSRKPVELCNTMLKNEQWFDVENGVHKTREEVLAEYDYVRSHQANYLLNVGLRGDGSVHPSDKAVLMDLFD